MWLVLYTLLERTDSGPALVELLMNFTYYFILWNIEKITNIYKSLHTTLQVCHKMRKLSRRHSLVTVQSASHDNWCTGTLLNRVITAQWEGMGDVGSARYEPALLPPCPIIRVLSYSNWQRSTHSISKKFNILRVNTITSWYIPCTGSVSPQPMNASDTKLQWWVPVQSGLCTGNLPQ